MCNQTLPSDLSCPHNDARWPQILSCSTTDEGSSSRTLGEYAVSARSDLRSAASRFATLTDSISLGLGAKWGECKDLQNALIENSDLEAVLFPPDYTEETPHFTFKGKIKSARNSKLIPKKQSGPDSAKPL